VERKPRKVAITNKKGRKKITAVTSDKESWVLLVSKTSAQPVSKGVKLIRERKKETGFERDNIVGRGEKKKQVEQEGPAKLNELSDSKANNNQSDAIHQESRAMRRGKALAKKGGVWRSGDATEVGKRTSTRRELPQGPQAKTRTMDRENPQLYKCGKRATAEKGRHSKGTKEGGRGNL